MRKRKIPQIFKKTRVTGGEKFKMNWTKRKYYGRNRNDDGKR